MHHCTAHAVFGSANGAAKESWLVLSGTVIALTDVMRGRRQDALNVLAESSLCRGMPPEPVAELATHASLLDRARGQCLYAEGAAATALFVITRGVVKLARALAGGRDVIFELCGRGDVLGEAALSDGALHDSRAVCVHPSTVLVIPRSEAIAFIISNPAAVRNVLAALHGNLLRAHRRVEDLSVFGVRQRLARFLIRLADWTGQEEHGRMVVPLALSRQELASLVGTTMETTIRVMTNLREEGLVEPAKSGMVLRDRAALELVAEGNL
jgi:CRP-like cAMP-binding protein